MQLRRESFADYFAPAPTIFAEEILADVALKTAKFSSSIVSHYSGEICIGVPIVVCRCILVAKILVAKQLRVLLNCNEYIIVKCAWQFFDL